MNNNKVAAGKTAKLKMELYSARTGKIIGHKGDKFSIEYGLLSYNLTVRSIGGGIAYTIYGGDSCNPFIDLTDFFEVINPNEDKINEIESTIKDLQKQVKELRHE